VGAFVVEVTQQKNLQRSLHVAADNLIRNLLSTAADPDALLRQLMNESGRRAPSSVAKTERSDPLRPLNGVAYPPPSAGLERLPGSGGAGDDGAPALTARERQIVISLAEGHGNKGTATILNISVKTVEAHKANIMLKLGLHSTAELVRHAIVHGMIKPLSGI
jgi:DNA-binding NarL/FixJ family response regulator